jgi:UDP-GlcNAc3NAcA epimerase
VRFASIVGARPQFVKLAPVSRAIRQHHQELILHTGQHYDDSMSAQFFDELALPAPNYHLGVSSGTHAFQTGRMLEAIERVLLKEHPDWVIVFGDTSSTLAGALAAAKLHIPIARVEAGLRSFNRAMPEEINRVVTDHLSDRLFCPTETARKHANHVGITRGVEVVGDVMYDILLQVQPQIDAHMEVLLPVLGVAPQAYVLVTVHRSANTDDPETMQDRTCTQQTRDAGNFPSSSTHTSLFRSLWHELEETCSNYRTCGIFRYARAGTSSLPHPHGLWRCAKRGISPWRSMCNAA